MEARPLPARLERRKEERRSIPPSRVDLWFRNERWGIFQEITQIWKSVSKTVTDKTRRKIVIS